MAGEDTVSQKSGEGTAGTTGSRTDAFAPASGAEYGFKDPDKVFPVQEYQGLQKTNLAARGEWQPKLKLPDGQPFEVPQDAVPEYPHNKVTESTNPNPDERHRMEIDDTPGDPRVTLVHKNGTGMEMMEKDGLLVVNSFGRMVQLVGDDFEMFVAGNGTVIYKGNLDFTVEGDMNLTVKGDMTTTVEGNKTEVVKKTKIEEYQDDQETTVTNSKSTTVGETNTELVLGNKNSFVKQKQSNWVKGDAEFLSGANTHISSQTKTSMSSTSLSMTGSTINVAGGAGTIGGPGVYHYGYAWDGDLNVTGGINASGNTALGGDLSVNGRVDVNEIVTTPFNTDLVYQEYNTKEFGFIYPDPLETAGSFGRSVSISSDGLTAVIGAPLNDPENEGNAGAAYIFEKGSDGEWTQSAKITASDKQISDFFGSAVDISNDGLTVIVGAYLEDTAGSNAGAAYIFEKGSGWSDGSTNQSAKIVGSDTTTSDLFGFSVAISGDGLTVIVGAYGHNLAAFNNDDEGAAYIFEKGSGWADGSTSQSAKIIKGGASGDPGQNDFFGYSVDISGDGLTVIVGAYLAGAGADGQALVYEKGSGWSDGSTNLSAYYGGSGYFGFVVAISGDGSTIAVAAALSSFTAATFVFEKGSGWSSSATQYRLNARSRGEPGGNDALSFSSDGSIIAVGTGGGGNASNYVYFFEKPSSGWSTTGQDGDFLIRPSDWVDGDDFGHSAALTGDGFTLIAGSPDRAVAPGGGKAYIFDIRKFDKVTPSAPFILDNTLYSEPTASNIGTALAASEEGIMQVTIDPGDKIKQSIDLRQRTGLGLGS
jgi:hypothetical protein